MQEETFYSVRMRASMNGSHEDGGKHISGGERLITFDNMKRTVNALLEKGLSHSRGKPDFMQIQFEEVHEPVKKIHPLPMKTNEVESPEEGQSLARFLLERAGVPRKVIEKAYQQIPEWSGIRGAVVFDIHTGKRVDQTHDKGVRVSRMDWPDLNFEQWAQRYGAPSNPRIKEALALASKVSEHPATIAELCWSDDPDYITGYVAGKKLGYQRITAMKEYGTEEGCRIFFADGSVNVNTYINDLEKQPILIEWEEDDDSKCDRKK
ncbi:6-carboxyhexanoate--CoA ligase [Bacillus halotolerans]|uniref:6-carboxyhexanoate--CoA ligase n=1 Tax=Bacillus halotolerans TaxID=260554 RepID=UPI000750C362|nr:6-carboxyhexanoate--CoA ligase [Bacillus halotolerans]KUP41434.1 6-carboxyhexanoate--CoA ligase [Bacillus halotolerans]MDL5613153.1 6-carboxyhexanoate--CoA ligase [Bacillus halotolerans]MEC0252390.1 6-carboxyhexanoate--CoA ligase [Bacillus halotolerans]MEC0280851.1 6-carboxyhexanoate--CoA ligase [Bacillus halotolerans]MEC0356509.1 6-carboxyhexanoate--CoA ligase [Bacillus halotolerans]